ncbi:MAG TPA: SDR family NAD(P)-dependent oxidoreductase [Egibacteraceae bacterium]|nr:SDR family NAD(P)-dependent oxidoreductase [Egibacteraceae bacterium]
MQIGGSGALVSGGASGLGQATVRALVHAGARVVIADLPTSDGKSAEAAFGHRARFVPTDVTVPGDVERAVDTAVTAFGGLHIAVSCAGVATAGRVLGSQGPLPLDVFATVVQVNLVGTFNVLRLAAARMAEQDLVGEERGVIVNTASIAAFEGQIGQAAYAASKAGVVGLTLPAARDLADRAIRVATVAPGTFDTPMLAALPAEVRASLAAAVPHPRRLGRPHEFAALVRHIIENPLLNGEVIRLDGALRMGPR